LGGWASAKALRGAKDRIKGDERILGDGNFVQAVLEDGKPDIPGEDGLKVMAIIDAAYHSSSSGQETRI